MKTRKAAKYMLALACAVVATSLALAGTAFAATVHGADYHASGSALEAGDIDVLAVDGNAGETVFLTVTYKGRTIAQSLPYTIGENAEAGDEATWAGVATLDISNLDLKGLDGSYAIEAYASRAGGDALYRGTIYGVYADLPDGTSKLIGTRTVNDVEANARDFIPPATVYDNGRTFKRDGEVSGAGALHYAYVEYDEATTVDGAINYIDSEGNVVATSAIPGIGYGEEVKVSVPDVVVADNGDLYRTVFFKDTVVAKNPGAVTFSIYAAKISEADKALAGYYVATIKMVDERGAVIASDTVDVTGNFVYTAPTTIYKKEKSTAIGAPAVVTYTVEGSPTIYLSASKDGVVNRARTITVQYSTQDPDAPSADVTFNLIDGTKHVGEKGRELGTREVTVTLDAPTATPPGTLDVDGVTFNLAGEPESYAYTLRSGEIPVVNVYYTPEGYEPPGSYEVTVNYVNYLNDKVIESHTYTSEPNTTGALEIETPATFSADGVDYIRLDGQEDAIVHSYYSGISSYTVYYRDKNDTYSAGTVINTIRVRYRDGGTEGDAANQAAPGADAADNANAADNAANGDNANANGEGDNQNVRLNRDRTYNVFGGDEGNGTMTNESGVDSNTERIEDNETPLASGFGKGGESSAASSLTGMGSWMIPVGIGLIAVIVVAAAVMAIRRKLHNDENEA